MNGKILKMVLTGCLAGPAMAVQAAEWHYVTTDSGATGTMMAQAAPSSAPAVAESAPATPAATMDMPRNNMTWTKVREKYGDPQQELPAVGKPPITRWKYADYIVYFEFDRVIISVPINI